MIADLETQRKKAEIASIRANTTATRRSKEQEISKHRIEALKIVASLIGIVASFAIAFLTWHSDRTQQRHIEINSILVQLLDRLSRVDGQGDAESDSQMVAAATMSLYGERAIDILITGLGFNSVTDHNVYRVIQESLIRAAGNSQSGIQVVLSRLQNTADRIARDVAHSDDGYTNILVLLVYLDSIIFIYEHWKLEWQDQPYSLRNNVAGGHLDGLCRALSLIDPAQIRLESERDRVGSAEDQLCSG